MAKPEDIAAVREAVRALDEAVSVLTGHYPESVDARRLQVGCSRVREDLDLLCGAEEAAPEPPATPDPPPSRMIIADTPYAHDFWMDAEDEGLGRADYRRS